MRRIVAVVALANDGNIVSTLDLLNAAGLLIDDRPTRVERYFATKTDALPVVMSQQLEV